tara:strand:+ start:841 stop:3894 length:3054 start_codon:yes stop_codon:yes gene_type:complete
MADEKVGNKTNKTTQVGRDVYETSDGEMVSEKSTTFQYKGKWINVPTIHNGYQYDDDTLRMLLNEGIIEPTSIHEDEPSASKAARERSDNLKFSKGGTPMQKQMELFGDGGLKDEGGMIDEVSGNEVPIGGTREGVRDDIPANVSEGEFIFPADVTRYLGLEKLMQLRQQAKMGLQEMDAMGQMGNSDEATMDDDLPFGMADIMVVSAGGEPMEFADGGFVPTKNYAPGGMGTTRSLSPEIIAPARTKIDFKQLMGEAAIEFKEYRNEEGKNIMVAHIGGVAAFPIPEGYTLYVADDSIGNGDTATDDIVADANNAVAEKALADEAYNAGYSSTATDPSSAIDWENLSTKELLEELPKITGVGSMIAKGAMLFLGPIGLAGYALIRNQEKRAAKATQANIAKGGLSSSELAALNTEVESLTTKSSGLFGKVLETVGEALGLTIEDVEETKKKADVVETQTSDSKEAAVPYDPQRMITINESPGVPAAIPTAQQVDPPKTMATATPIQDNSNLQNVDPPKIIAQTAEGPYGSLMPGNDMLASTSSTFSLPVTAQTNSALGTTREDFGASVPETRFTAPVAPPLEPLENYQAPSKKGLLSEKNAGTFFNRLGEKVENFITGTPISEQQAIDLGYSKDTEQPVKKKSDAQIVADARALMSEEANARIDAGTNIIKEIGVPAYTEKVSISEDVTPNDITPELVTPNDVTPTPVVTAPENTGQEDSFSFTPPNANQASLTVAPIATTPGLTDDDMGLPTTAVPAASVAEQTNQAFSNSGQEDSFSFTPPNKNQASLTVDPVASVAAPTFNEKFATERLAGAKTFSYDRDGDGTMESYTTQTVEEASPAGSNSLYERIANFLTPGDDKEYQGGKIVNTGSKKTTVKKKSNSAKNAIAGLQNNNGGINVNTTDTAILGKVSNDGNWQEVVQPGTNAITRKWVGSDNDNNDNSNGGSLFSGGGADDVGNFGAIGDAFGAIGDALGITNYSGDSDTNAYKGGLLTKPKSKKKTKATTKKRGLAARK